MAKVVRNENYDPEELSLTEQINNPDLGPDEWIDILDNMMTNDMALGPARKAMIEAGRKKRSQMDSDPKER